MRFESSKNTTRYTTDGIDTVIDLGGGDDSNVDGFWSLGSCTEFCSTATECGDPSIVAHTLIKP